MNFVQMEVLANERERWLAEIEMDRQLEELELIEEMRRIEADWLEKPVNQRGHYFWSEKYQVGVYAPVFGSYR